MFPSPGDQGVEEERLFCGKTDLFLNRAHNVVFGDGHGAELQQLG